MFMRTPYHTPGQLLITIVASLWVSSPVLGADTTEEINSSRLRNGIYVGSNLTTGRLIYQSDTVESKGSSNKRSPLMPCALPPADATDGLEAHGQ
jgi:hypothetical protein